MIFHGEVFKLTPAGREHCRQERTWARRKGTRITEFELDGFATTRSNCPSFVFDPGLYMFPKSDSLVVPLAYPYTIGRSPHCSSLLSMLMVSVSSCLLFHKVLTGS